MMESWGGLPANPQRPDTAHKEIEMDSSKNLMQASRQWASRPVDERFTSLLEMQSHFANLRANSREIVVSSRRLQAVPDADHKGLPAVAPTRHGYPPTNSPSRPP